MTVEGFASQALPEVPAVARARIDALVDPARIDGRPVGLFAEVHSRQPGAYDVRRVVCGIVDEGSFLDLQQSFARNLVIGFASVEGRSMGVVANQPHALAGVLDEADSVIREGGAGSGRSVLLAGSQMAVMGADGAVDLVHRRELEADPALRAELVQAYQEVDSDETGERRRTILRRRDHPTVADQDGGKRHSAAA